MSAKLLFINFGEYSEGAQITGRFNRAVCARRDAVLSKPGGP